MHPIKIEDTFIRPFTAVKLIFIHNSHEVMYLLYKIR